MLYFTPPFRDQRARTSVFYREMRVETIKRRETYTYSDFMAICGGLLGLFVGMSALSAIEFIYYGSLRYYWEERRKRADAKKAANKKIVSVIPIDGNEIESEKLRRI